MVTFGNSSLLNSNRSLHPSLQHPHAQDFLGQPRGPLFNSGLKVWPRFLLCLIHQILSDSTHSGSALLSPPSFPWPPTASSLLFSPVYWEYRRVTSNYMGAGNTNTGLDACVVSIFIHRAISPSLCTLEFMREITDKAAVGPCVDPCLV